MLTDNTLCSFLLADGGISNGKIVSVLSFCISVIFIFRYFLHLEKNSINTVHWSSTIHSLIEFRTVNITTLNSIPVYVNFHIFFLQNKTKLWENFEIFWCRWKLKLNIFWTWTINAKWKILTKWKVLNSIWKTETKVISWGESTNKTAKTTMAFEQSSFLYVPSTSNDSAYQHPFQVSISMFWISTYFKQPQFK